MLQLGHQDWLALEREISFRSLAEYTKLAWHVIEPGTPYKHNWHVDCIGEHLQACASGQINRLLLNMPPGTMKSTLTGVIYPSWLWGPAGKPHTRFVGASHEQTLATRDNRKTRTLVESEWFQERWPIKLTSDQNEKTFFENLQLGFRLSCPVNSMTGKRGDTVLWDDPHSPESAYSDPKRETAIRVFNETLPSRVNDPVKSSIIVVMQRLHERDVSGHILTGDYGYTHVCLPMEFDPDRRYYTPLGWTDPRTKPGELLFEARFPREVVDRDKKVMGSFAVAGQFQQRPVPREGGMFRRADFQFISAAPLGTRWVRGWDLAATSEEEDPNSARTAWVLMGEAPDGRVIIAHAGAERLGPNEVTKQTKAIATQDKAKYRHVRGSLPQDPGAGGKAWAKSLIANLKGFDYHYTVESGDKETRALAFAAQVEAGNVYLVEGDWNESYLAEVEMFPGGQLKDQVDASSRAFTELFEPKPKAIVLRKRAA